MGQNQTKKKNDFVEAYRRLGGNVSAACKSTGLPRQTYYRWRKDEAFRRSVEDAYEETIDFVESKLLKEIENGNITAIIFFLKTKGKSRGYIETKEILTQPPTIEVHTEEAKDKLMQLKSVKNAETD